MGLQQNRASHHNILIVVGLTVTNWLLLLAKHSQSVGFEQVGTSRGWENTRGAAMCSSGLDWKSGSFISLVDKTKITNHIVIGGKPKSSGRKSSIDATTCNKIKRQLEICTFLLLFHCSFHLSCWQEVLFRHLVMRHHHSLHPRRQGCHHPIRSVLKHEAGGVRG